MVSFLAFSKKYIIIKEFKNELRDVKNILNDIKNGTIEGTRKSETNSMCWMMK